MIEVIFIIIFFATVGCILGTVMGYFWLGLACVFIIVASIVIGALIIQGACVCAQQVVDRKQNRPKHRKRKYLTEEEVRNIESTSMTRWDKQPQPPTTVVNIAVMSDKIKHNQ